MQFVDYDGVRFRLSTPESKSVLVLSMHIRCWDELVRYGALDVLKREYGAMLLPQPESEHNVSLQIDAGAAPPEGGACILRFLLRVLLNSDAYMTLVVVNFRGSRGPHPVAIPLEAQCSRRTIRTCIPDPA